MNPRLLVAVLIIFSGVAQAQTTTTTLPAAAGESTLKEKSLLLNKKFEDSKEITDTKIKADSGSLSKYSLKFSFSFNGPPVGDLSNEKQPNPDGSVGNNDTAIGGSISGRYRIDSKSAVSAGTGISALTPFQGAKRTDVKTPFISYDRSARVSDVQMRNSFGASLTTVPEYRDVGQVGGVSYDSSFVYNIDDTKFAIGLDSSADIFIYERSYEKKDRTAGRYNLGFFPQVKYNFSDKLNMYSSLNFSFSNPRSRDDNFALLNKTLSQRLGMGIGFTRTIYFAPYLNFYPKDIRLDTTTISFATIFSIL